LTFAVGALVKARGREWVVLPGSQEDLLLVRPLGGTDDEVTGIYRPLESVDPASFDLPDPAELGDHRSCRLLREAVRLGFRSSAGPFRSFGQIAVEPRPYQLVPLLMALKLDPVRLLIADDVGIGKTIEACLIVRELLDRGEARRLAVLCPPHLAEQWQKEIFDKFHIETELVLPGTATRLERACALDQSIFDVYPHVIVSTEFIKSDRRREEFLRTCPELVVVDEAHTCAADAGRGRHQRHELVKGLSADPKRHLILVTATPHSGKEDAFRSLLALLNADFANLPDDLTGKENEHHRRRLAGTCQRL
jgi:SNF2 family DNA or RNA helicase